MCSKKKDLEIICNLQWKNKPHNGGERSNIIGLYDVPSTTLNWEIFKSYLLKNSGTPGDDVKVSYLATNDREFPIQSQVDFQIALYAFRKKARNGEIIHLKLDRISSNEKTMKKSPTSNDVQTQFDTDAGACCSSSLGSMDNAPQWFTNYMTEFKKDILSEVSATVSNYVSTIKSHGVQSSYHRKSKTESSKRSRKHPLILCEVGNEKEFLKTLKLEKKVETKLEKLESKSKKLKEKKMSLLTKSSDSDAGHSSSKSNSETILNVDMGQMNAAPVRHQQSVIPHMMGGEVYLHSWEVINNGLLPWTSETELHFTWGSAMLSPVERIVPCPPLKPGETGSINVLLNVPKACGQYESYWYFHHRGRKFGHWLGCQLIVDKINSAEPLSNSFLRTYSNLLANRLEPDEKNKEVDISQNDKTYDSEPIRKVETIDQMCKREFNLSSSNSGEKIHDLQTSKACSSSDSDQKQDKNTTPPDEFIFVTRAPSCQSNEIAKEEPASSQPLQTEIEEVVLNASPSKIQIVEKFFNDLETAKADSSNLEKTSNDFKEPNQNKQIDLESDDNNNNTEGGQDSSSESISKIDEDTASNSTLNDMVMINFSDDMEDHDTGYAYVLVDGSKIPIPKKYLRSDFLETAEDAPDPTKIVKTSDGHNEVTSTEKIETDAVNPVQENENVPKNETDIKIESNMQPSTSTPSRGNPFNGENNMHPEQAKEVGYSFIFQEALKINDSLNHESPVNKATHDNSSLGDSSSIEGKFNSRLFVFPQNCPGYEVVPEEPVLPEVIQKGQEPPTFTGSSTQYSYSNDGSNSQYMKCNIYGQDPSGSTTQFQYTAPLPPYHHSVFTNAPSQNGFSYNAFPIQPMRINPVDSSSFNVVPNYQQTPPELRPQVRKPEEPKVESQASNISSTYSYASSTENVSKESSAAHVNPAPMASVVTGAMTMASSALNTAKNVVNMIIPPRNEHGHWINGHWVVTNPETPREANLQALAEMGFWDRDLNATLLARYNDDIAQVVADLIQ
ncbi:hypothetical protein HHI36_020054 [Cryptolaemus montrouzieri]|uniref:Nbr1 FW domain-containing protein n=1 Tax=Cryptolaemus montrouzieri TaxID=559131 RepID=A0ABD2N933_9CUCU